MPTVLILLLVLPLATAFVVAALGPARVPAIRWLSLTCTLVCLVLAAVVCIDFAAGRVRASAATPATEAASAIGAATNPTAAAASALKTISIRSPLSAYEPTYVTRFDLVSFNTERVGPIQFYIGLDGMNVWLVLLVAVLMVPSVLCSWTAVTERVHEFHAWLLALQTGMFGVFLAFDIVLFYVFFELTLVPLFFLIGIWGGPERQYAARKFFVYTLAGSLITLLGVIGLVLTLGNDVSPTNKRMTFAIPELVAQSNAQDRKSTRLNSSHRL